MNRFTCLLAVVVAGFFGSAAAQTPTATPSPTDDSGDVEITVQAPIDSTNCSGTPATITVLGLSIDISNAAFDVEEGNGEDGGPTPTPTSVTNACAALQPGQFVEVQLASDTKDSNGNLDATSVDQGDQDLAIQAPLQPIDANGDATDGQHIQLLGLSIDISQLAQQSQGEDQQGATQTPGPTETPSGQGMQGDDDSGNPSTPIGPSNLMVGQIVEVQLDASQLPNLVATSLEVKSFTNQVDVEVDDQSGTPVEDSSDDVTVEVDDTVVVPAPSPTPGGGAATTVHRWVKKTFRFQVATTGGTVSLSGLPKGHARISVTRSSNNTSGHRMVVIRPNKQRAVRIRLRAQRAL